MNRSTQLMPADLHLLLDADLLSLHRRSARMDGGSERGNERRPPAARGLDEIVDELERRDLHWAGKGAPV